MVARDVTSYTKAEVIQRLENKFAKAIAKSNKDKVVRKGKGSFKRESRPDEATLNVNGIKTAKGKNCRHCSLYSHGHTQKKYLNFSEAPTQWRRKGQKAGTRKHYNKKERSSHQMTKKELKAYQQDMTIIGCAIQENRILEAILRKAMENVKEVKTKVQKMNELDIQDDENEILIEQMHQGVEEIFESVRGYCKEVQYKVEKMTIIKNKLGTIAEFKRKSKYEFWNAVGEFHRGQDRSQKNGIFMANEANPNNAIQDFEEEVDHIIECGTKFETITKEDLQAERKEIFKNVGLKRDDKDWNPWNENGEANPLPQGKKQTDMKFESMVEYFQWMAQAPMTEKAVANQQMRNNQKEENNDETGSMALLKATPSNDSAADEYSHHEFLGGGDDESVSTTNKKLMKRLWNKTGYRGDFDYLFTHHREDVLDILKEDVVVEAGHNKRRRIVSFDTMAVDPNMELSFEDDVSVLTSDNDIMDRNLDTVVRIKKEEDKYPIEIHMCCMGIETPGPEKEIVERESSELIPLLSSAAIEENPAPKPLATAHISSSIDLKEDGTADDTTTIHKSGDGKEMFPDLSNRLSFVEELSAEKDFEYFNTRTLYAPLGSTIETLKTDGHLDLINYEPPQIYPLHLKDIGVLLINFDTNKLISKEDRNQVLVVHEGGRVRMKDFLHARESNFISVLSHNLDSIEALKDKYSNLYTYPFTNYMLLLELANYRRFTTFMENQTDEDCGDNWWYRAIMLQIRLLTNDIVPYCSCSSPSMSFDSTPSAIPHGPSGPSDCTKPKETLGGSDARIGSTIKGGMLSARKSTPHPTSTDDDIHVAKDSIDIAKSSGLSHPYLYHSGTMGDGDPDDDTPHEGDSDSVESKASTSQHDDFQTTKIMRDLLKVASSLDMEKFSMEGGLQVRRRKHEEFESNLRIILGLHAKTKMILGSYPKIKRPKDDYVNAALATFILAKLKGHARTIAISHLSDGVGMIKDLRRHCSHITPQIKLDTFQKLLTLKQSKNEASTHYLARWRRLYNLGIQMQAFDMDETAAVDCVLKGMDKYMPIYTNLIATLMARRQHEEALKLPKEQRLTLTAIEDAFIDLDTSLAQDKKNEGAHSAMTNRNIICNYCGHKGHKEFECRKKRGIC